MGLLDGYINVPEGSQKQEIVKKPNIKYLLICEEFNKNKVCPYDKLLLNKTTIHGRLSLRQTYLFIWNMKSPCYKTFFSFLSLYLFLSASF